MPISPDDDHGGLGRAAAHVAEQRERDLDEVVAGAGLLEQRAEQHEQEDVAGRDAERDAEHAFGRQPVVRHRLVQRDALVRQHVGHVGPGEDVDSIRSAMIASGGPTTRRVASSSSTMPIDRGDDVERGRLAGRWAELGAEQEQVGAHSAPSRANTQSASGIRWRDERCGRPDRRGTRGRSRTPRCSERISVSLRMPTLNMNGSGEAYQSWSSDQARHAEQQPASQAGRHAPAEVGLGHQRFEIHRRCGVGGQGVIN